GSGSYRFVALDDGWSALQSEVDALVDSGALRGQTAAMLHGRIEQALDFAVDGHPVRAAAQLSALTSTAEGLLRGDSGARFLDIAGARPVALRARSARRGPAWAGAPGPARARRDAHVAAGRRRPKANARTTDPSGTGGSED